MYVFPTSVSSAGVPYRRTVPEKPFSSMTCFSAIAPLVDAAPNTLCPHPWPEVVPSSRSFR